MTNLILVLAGTSLVIVEIAWYVWVRRADASRDRLYAGMPDRRSPLA